MKRLYRVTLKDTILFYIRFQEFHQGLHGAAAVADGVFGGLVHLGEGLVEAGGTEDGVVAEAGGAPLFGDDFAIDATLKDVLFAVKDEGDDGLEAGLAVGGSLHFGHHLADIVLEAASGACVACGIDAGAAVERLDFQAGVVGKAIDTVFVVDVFRFLSGVAQQRIGCFGNFLKTAEFCDTFHDTRSTCDGNCFL